jgi:hypothetical protein
MNNWTLITLISWIIKNLTTFTRQSLWRESSLMDTNIKNGKRISAKSKAQSAERKPYHENPNPPPRHKDRRVKGTAGKSTKTLKHEIVFSHPPSLRP